jgi:hypothetical protein
LMNKCIAFSWFLNKGSTVIFCYFSSSVVSHLLVFFFGLLRLPLASLIWIIA